MTVKIPSFLCAAAPNRVALLLASLLAAGSLPLLASAADVQAAAAPAAGQASAQTIPALITAHVERGLLLSAASAGKRLVAVGGNGAIVISSDGSHWTQVPSPVDVTLTGVAFADELHGWAVGHDALILRTDDGGLHWTVQNSQPDLTSPMFAVLALDLQKALAVGAFGTLKITEDGGKTWADVDAPDVVQEKLHLNAVTRLASGELFVAGEHGLAAYSTDGHQWQRLKIPYEGSLFGALPWGSQGAITFGMRGNVFATDDIHADNWQRIDAHTTASFFGGQVLPNNNIALVGADGQIILIDRNGVARPLADNTKWKGQASSFAGSALFGKSLVVVGEPGVFRVPLN